MPKKSPKAAKNSSKSSKKTSKPAAKKKPASPKAPKLDKKASAQKEKKVVVSKAEKVRPPKAVKTPAAKESGKTKASGKNGKHAAASKPGPLAAALAEPQDITEKLRELMKLAKEQGYITFDDLNEALPESVNDPEEMEAVITRLRSLEVDIIDASDVDRYKDGKKADSEEEEVEEKVEKLDVLDDPVRMYLKQMGQVPLLTREQEVEISKRIEEAELAVQTHINRFGFTPRAYLDLALKLKEGRERFDRVILDKKIESRERYMKQLPKLCLLVEKQTVDVAKAYKTVLGNGSKPESKTAQSFKKIGIGYIF